MGENWLIGSRGGSILYLTLAPFARDRRAPYFILHNCSNEMLSFRLSFTFQRVDQVYFYRRRKHLKKEKDENWYFSVWWSRQRLRWFRSLVGSRNASTKFLFEASNLLSKKPQTLRSFGVSVKVFRGLSWSLFLLSQLKTRFYSIVKSIWKFKLYSTLLFTHKKKCVGYWYSPWKFLHENICFSMYSFWNMYM